MKRLHRLWHGHDPVPGLYLGRKRFLTRCVLCVDERAWPSAW